MKHVSADEMDQEPVRILKIGGTTIKIMAPPKYTEAEYEAQLELVRKAARNCWLGIARENTKAIDRSRQEVVDLS